MVLEFKIYYEKETKEDFDKMPIHLNTLYCSMVHNFQVPKSRMWK